MSVLYSFNPMEHSDKNLRTNPEMDSIQHLNSGLLRYHSAPSSFLKDLLNEETSRSIGHHHHHNHPSSSSEMEAMLGKLVSSSNNGWMKQEEEAKDSVSEGYDGYNPNSYGSQVIYQKSQQVQNLPNDGSFNSTKSTLGPNNLLRQKSSPAGLLENAWRDVGSFRGCDVSNGTTTNLAFSSRPSSSSCTRQLPQIAENGNETLVEEATCVQSRNLRNDNGSYVPSFTSEFWDGSSSFNDSKSGSDNDEIMFSTSDGFETQNAGFDYQNLGLTHHMSLPSSSTRLSAIDKFLQVQPYVPCKIRAKRGFATHPRSIAERVRRTRISERIKKLQELFPKSDKQTSTADMLDLAVDYIKGLQKQVKILTDTRAKCRCSSN